MTPYRYNLVKSYNVLLNLHERLFNRIINVEMLGDLADISNTFQPGDSYFFQIEQFRDSKDRNVQLLVELYDRLEDTMNSLANINSITEEELDEVAEDDDDDDY